MSSETGQNESCFMLEAYSKSHKMYLDRKTNENRFVKFEDREERSVLDADMLKILSHGTNVTCSLDSLVN